MNTKTPEAAVLFPSIYAALLAVAVHAGFDPAMLLLTSAVLPAYAFIWAWDYVMGDQR